VVRAKKGAAVEGRKDRARLREKPQQIADELRRLIVSGQLSEGDSLGREPELVERFGVSRPSLREALRILEAEGLISVVRGMLGGVVVHAPDTYDGAHRGPRAPGEERIPRGRPRGENPARAHGREGRRLGSPRRARGTRRPWSCGASSKSRRARSWIPTPSGAPTRASTSASSRWRATRP
jgi:DNA-binding transcriptional MocR family regulator